MTYFTVFQKIQLLTIRQKDSCAKIDKTLGCLVNRSRTDGHAFPDPGAGQVAGADFLLLRGVPVVQQLLECIVLLPLVLRVHQLISLEKKPVQPSGLVAAAFETN